MGGILEYAGVEGFLNNLDQFHGRQRAEDAEWEKFFHCWHEELEGKPVTARKVGRTFCPPADSSQDADHRDKLPGELAAEAPAPGDEARGDFNRALGNALHGQTDHRYGSDEIHVERAGSDDGENDTKWRVVKAT